jgi:hypothetical protein
MHFEIDSEDSPERDDLLPVERFMVGAVRLASLPLFLLVIILSSLIYGIAILARLVAGLVFICFRLIGALARALSRPMKAHDI